MTWQEGLSMSQYTTTFSGRKSCESEDITS